MVAHWPFPQQTSNASDKRVIPPSGYWNLGLREDRSRPKHNSLSQALTISVESSSLQLLGMHKLQRTGSPFAMSRTRKSSQHLSGWKPTFQLRTVCACMYQRTKKLTLWSLFGAKAVNCRGTNAVQNFPWYKPLNASSGNLQKWCVHSQNE